MLSFSKYTCTYLYNIYYINIINYIKFIPSCKNNFELEGKFKIKYRVIYTRVKFIIWRNKSTGGG